MTGPVQQNNLVPESPSMKDLLDLHKKDIFLTLNCHALGTVESFNSTNQTAKVTINYKRTRFQFDSTTGAYVPVLIDYPVIVDAPVVCLGGGTASLTFPILGGEECLIFFNDRDIDNWFNGSNSGAVATQRAHSFSDALILVGVRSLANVLKSYDAVRAVLKCGNAVLAAGGGGGELVKIANESTSLNTLLQSLLTDLQTLCTTSAAGFTTQASASTGPLSPLAPGFTALATAFTAASTQLATLATQIAGLLE